jgi:glycosyltransferase involved in cell wall biosynthesis
MGRCAGGVGVHVGGLASALVAAGHQVLVCGPADCVPAPAKVRRHHIRVGRQPHPLDTHAVLELARVTAGADIVHAHGLRAGALAVLATRLRRWRGRGPMVVVTLHNAPPAKGTGALIAHILGRITAHADQVLTVSPDLSTWIAGLGAPKVADAIVAPARHHQPAGQDRAQVEAAVRAELGIGPDVPIILTVARLASQKGLDLLLQTALLLRTRARGGKEPVWLIAGDGPDRAALVSQIAEFNAPVRLLGTVDDVGRLLDAASVVVSTSLWEGQPLGLQEALRHGAAIVATNVGGTARTLAGGGTLVSTDPQELAQAVSSLLQDPDQLDQARARALEAGSRLPTLAQTTQQVLGIYGSDWTGRHAPAPASAEPPSPAQEAPPPERPSDFASGL